MLRQNGRIGDPHISQAHNNYFHFLNLSSAAACYALAQHYLSGAFFKGESFKRNWLFCLSFMACAGIMMLSVRRSKAKETSELISWPPVKR